jgi:hypothetical protein
MFYTRQPDVQNPRVITLPRIKGTKSEKGIFGGDGHRSRYLPYAKRALYHLSYTPISDRDRKMRSNSNLSAFMDRLLLFTRFIIFTFAASEISTSHYKKLNSCISLHSTVTDTSDTGNI